MPRSPLHGIGRSRARLLQLVRLSEKRAATSLNPFPNRLYIGMGTEKSHRDTGVSAQLPAEVEAVAILQSMTTASGMV